MNYFFAILLTILTILCIFVCYVTFTIGLYTIGQTNIKQQIVTSGTFHMKYGGAVCGHHYMTNCGVHLVKCNDDKEYHCMVDVSVDLDRK